jgi:O-antigen ligase
MDKISKNKILISKKKYMLHMIILTLILFSASAFHSEANAQNYIYAILGVCFLTYFYILFKLKVIIEILRNRYILWTFAFWVYLFLYGVVFAGLFHPVYGDFNLDYRFFTLVVIFIVFIWFIDVPSNKAVDILIKSSAIASLLLCLFIFINEREIIMMGARRIGDSASGNVNTVGIYLGVFFILTLYKVIYEKSYIYVPLSMIQLSFLLLTGSKKALLIIIIGTLIMCVIKIRFRVYKYVTPIALIVIILCLSVNNAYLYDIIGFRVIDFLGELGFNVEGASYSYSTYIRKQMLFNGLEAFLQSPLWGNGWFYFSRYSGLNTYSHNNYIEILVTHGLIGLVFYYSIFVLILRRLFSQLNKNMYAGLFITLIISILVIDMAAITYYDSPRNYILLFFAYQTVKEIEFH